MSRLIGSKTLKQALVSQEQLSLSVLCLQNPHTGDALLGRLRKIMHSPSRRPAFAVQIVRSAHELSLRRARDDTEQQILSEAREIAESASVRQVARSTQNATIRHNRIARFAPPLSFCVFEMLLSSICLFTRFLMSSTFQGCSSTDGRSRSSPCAVHVPYPHTRLS